MPKKQTAFLLIFLVFLITLGLAISLQGVLGINIGSVLNFNPAGNKITNVGTPTDAGDAATWDFVKSAAGAPVPTGLYGYCENSFWTDAIGNPFSACGANAPAFCTAQNICTCPEGYTMKRITVTVSGGSQSYKNTCYKN